jgi:hypothetical protein
MSELCDTSEIYVTFVPHEENLVTSLSSLPEVLNVKFHFDFMKATNIQMQLCYQLMLTSGLYRCSGML